MGRKHLLGKETERGTAVMIAMQHPPRLYVASYRMYESIGSEMIRCDLVKLGLVQ